MSIEKNIILIKTVTESRIILADIEHVEYNILYILCNCGFTNIYTDFKFENNLINLYDVKCHKCKIKFSISGNTLIDEGVKYIKPEQEKEKPKFTLV